MRLTARSIDEGLTRFLAAPTAAGSVLSVHDAATYLRTASGEILVLADLDAGNGPGFILLHPREYHTGAMPRMKAGDGFSVGGALVVIGNGRVTVALSGSARWDPAIQPSRLPSYQCLANCVAVLRRVARRRSRTGGLGPLLEQSCKLLSAEPGRGEGCGGRTAILLGRVRALGLALADSHCEGAERAAQSLIGLGEGFTPSCDDMLVGILGFFFGVNVDPAYEAWASRAVTLLGDAIRRESDRTTPVSCHFLRAAASGRFAERVKDLIEAFFSGDTKRVERTAERVLEYGATSGVDLIVGISLGHEIMARATGREGRRG